MKKTILLACALVAGAACAEFKAGFARIEATPPLGIPLVGYFSHRVSDGVLDPLYIDCVAVSDGTNNALIYCVDDLHLTNPFMEKAFPAITAATGIPRDRIYVHATHIHTGPADWKRGGFSEEENRLVMSFADTRVKKMAEVAKTALADMAPAKIGIARTVCRNISFIRRYRMKDGSVRTNPGITNPDVKEPLGTPDETLQLVRFRRTGAPDIAIVNFGVHPDTVGGTKYSADWPGVLRNTFEAAVGDGVKCLFLNGAQGDVNHHYRFPPPGRAALNAERKARPRAIALHMGRLPTADEVKWVEMFDAGRKNEIPLGHMEIMTLTSPGSRVRRLKNGPDHFDILVSSLAIGDSLAFAGVPCEPFVDIGRAVKRQARGRSAGTADEAEGNDPVGPARRAGRYMTARD